MSILEDPEWLAIPETVRDKLLEKHRDHDVQHDWWDGVYEDFEKNIAPAHGLSVDDMYFSGFWSQGDGACFSGRVEDWHKLLAHLKKPDKWKVIAADCDWRCAINTRGHYCHSGTMSASGDLAISEDYANPYDEDDQPLRFDAWRMTVGKDVPSDTDLDTLMEEIETLARSLADGLYTALEEEHDYLTSDEHVAEFILEYCQDEIKEAVAELAEEEAELGV